MAPGNSIRIFRGIRHVEPLRLPLVNQKRTMLWFDPFAWSHPQFEDDCFDSRLACAAALRGAALGLRCAGSDVSVPRDNVGGTAGSISMIQTLSQPLRDRRLNVIVVILATGILASLIPTFLTRGTGTQGTACPGRIGIPRV